MKKKIKMEVEQRNMEERWSKEGGTDVGKI